MKHLPVSYRKNGFDYTLLDFNGVCCVYKQNLGDICVGYEVSHILHLPESTRLMGETLVKTEAGEYLPGTSQWGAKAWTLKSPEAALVKLSEQTTILRTKAKLKIINPNE